MHGLQQLENTVLTEPILRLYYSEYCELLIRTIIESEVPEAEHAVVLGWIRA